MDFQIIALDIDGTLTDDRKKISSLTLETLIEAIGLPKCKVCTHCFDGSSCF